MAVAAAVAAAAAAAAVAKKRGCVGCGHSWTRGRKGEGDGGESDRRQFHVKLQYWTTTTEEGGE